MTETKTTLRVQELAGELWRYRVESHTEGDIAHSVDLSEMGGAGTCTCPFWKFNVSRNLERLADRAQDDARLDGEALSRHEALLSAHIPYSKGRKGVTECKHIRAAREHLYKHRVRPLLASFTKGVPPDIGDRLRAFLRH